MTPIINTKNDINQESTSEYQIPTAIFLWAKISPINATSGGSAMNQICIRTYKSGIREFKKTSPLIIDIKSVIKNMMNNMDTLNDVSMLASSCLRNDNLFKSVLVFSPFEH